MREYPPGATEVEKEILDHCDYFKECYKKEIPVTAAQKAEMKKDFTTFEHWEKFVKDNCKNRAESDFNPDFLFYEQCPECKKVIHSKAIGKIVLDNGWTYNLFYCKDCYLNFNGSYPNNNLDQFEWFKNDIKLLKEVDADGVPGWAKRGYSKSKYKKEEEKLRIQLANFGSFMVKDNLTIKKNLESEELTKAWLSDYRIAKANLENGMSIYDPNLSVAATEGGEV